jgi:hypothetical protein
MREVPRQFHMVDDMVISASLLIVFKWQLYLSCARYAIARGFSETELGDLDWDDHDHHDLQLWYGVTCLFWITW